MVIVITAYGDPSSTPVDATHEVMMMSRQWRPLFLTQTVKELSSFQLMLHIQIKAPVSLTALLSNHWCKHSSSVSQWQ